MRQHAEFERELAGLRQVLGRGREATAREELAVRAVRLLGLVAQAEEGLDTAAAQPSAHGFADFVEAVRLGVGIVVELGERAVATAVTAEIRERDEDVLRDRDDVALDPLLTLEGGLEKRLEDLGAGQLSRQTFRGLAFERSAVEGLGDEALRITAAEPGVEGRRAHKVSIRLRAGGLWQYTTRSELSLGGRFGPRSG